MSSRCAKLWPMIMGCAAYRDGHLIQDGHEGVPSPITGPKGATVATATPSLGSHHADNHDVDRITTCATAAAAEGGFVWIGLLDPTEAELATIGRAFDIHPLALEDAQTSWERPRVDINSQTLTVVMQPARYDEVHEIVEFGQITILAGPDYLIAVRHGNAIQPTDIRQAMESDPAWLAQGPGAVLHAMIDRVVESYGPVIAGVTDDVEEVEAQVFSDHRSSPTQRIYELKREVIQFAKAVGPLVGILRELSTADHPLISHELQKYFSDIGDDAQLFADQTTTQRDLLTSALQANMTEVSLKQNEDMRRISAWGAILAVPTMISGVYGMNFNNMPELQTNYGYFIVIGVMATASASLYFYFKKIGWL